MNIFLHIGRARTGSTSFQTGMAKSRERLRSEGICYPGTRKNDPRHMPLFWSATKERLDELHPWHGEMYDGLPLAARIAATMEEARDAKSVVLSNEWFSVAFEEEVFREMVSRLSEYGKVTALAVLRDQGDVMVSAWSRRIMDRERVGPLDRMTASKADWGKKAKPLSHLSTVRMWSDMCDMKLLRYSGNTASRLARLCGVESDIEFPVLSKSVSLDLCEYLRVRLEERPGPAQWKKLLADVADEPDRYSEFTRPETLRIADDLKKRVRSIYADSNDALESEFASLFVEDANP